MGARRPRTRASADAAERLEEVLRIAHLGSWVWLVGPDRVTWSEEFGRIFGVDPHRIATYHDFLALVHPDDRAETDRAIRAALEHKAPYVQWHRIVRPDGGERVLQSGGDVVVGPSGEPERLVGTCLDVTEKRQDYFDLARSLSLLRATLESTADGILVTDLGQRIVVYNQRFVDLWGIPAEALAERLDDQALAAAVGHVIEPARFVARVHELRRDASASSFDVIELADGRVFERYSRPQRIGAEIVGRVWSFRDVSDRVHAESERDQLLESEREARRLADTAAAEARWLAEQAERALAEREEFLSVASHELRGPLTSMRLAVQSLTTPKTPLEARAHVLEILARQTEKVTSLVEDLLEVSRIRRGQFAMELREVDLVALVRQVVSRFEPELARTRTPLGLSLAPSAMGRWDPGRLDQVVTNLLSNALKFGAGRPLEVKVEPREGKVCLEVRDQGIGMTSEVAAQAFEPFKRGVSARHYGGLGLGLYIVERIVSALGGTVELRSAPGAGTTFLVELPTEGAPVRAD